MSDFRLLGELLSRRSDEVKRFWLDAHLSSVALQSEREVVGQVHDRSLALIEAWSRALLGPEPEDSASFEHREVVQLIASMSHALAEAGVTAATAGALVTALGRACEEAGAGGEFLGALLPLASVAGEAYVSARASKMRREELERLARTTPVLSLPGGVIMVAACGSPDRQAADEIVDRCLRRILSSATSAPLVVLDLSHLETEEPGVVASLMGLSADVSGLDGFCKITGLNDTLRELALEAEVDLTELELVGSLAGALDELLHPGLLSRLGRAFR